MNDPYLVTNQFLSGAIMMTCWAISFFFLQSWRRTSDRFFATFAAAFWVLGLERIILLIVSPENEIRPFVYVVRLIAFVLILMAIFDKNRAASRSRG